MEQLAREAWPYFRFPSPRHHAQLSIDYASRLINGTQIYKPFLGGNVLSKHEPAGSRIPSDPAATFALRVPLASQSKIRLLCRNAGPGLNNYFAGGCLEVSVFGYVESCPRNAEPARRAA